MIRISTKTASLLTIVLLLLTQAVIAADWPVKRKIDLSSGFGDFRPGHFHSGVDIRTGGQEGIEIFAPVDGYLYRAKMSYTGGGKALYLMGDDNYLYVFFHLSRFADKAYKPVLKKEIAENKYSQDLYFQKDSIRFTRGELLGLTGQSGYGAPHLHFEKRTSDNRPINPLANGFKLDEKIRPTFADARFRLTDLRTLFDDGSRIKTIKAVKGKKPGEYHLKETPYFSTPFGIMSNCFDQMKASGMKQAIYDLALYIDDQLYYKVKLDTLDYQYTENVHLEFDYLAALDDEKRVRRLFSEAGNDFPGSSALMPHNGLFGLNGEKEGRHKVKIVAIDNYNNQATLNFNFFWGSSEAICQLDSSSFKGSTEGTFYFQLPAYWSDLSVDSIAVIKNEKNTWTPIKAEYSQTGGNTLKLELSTPAVMGSLLRLRLIMSNGSLIEEPIFNGIEKIGKKYITAAYELTEDGILVHLTGRLLKAGETRLALFYKDSLLGIEYPRPVDIQNYFCLVPPLEKYKRIDRIGFAMSTDESMALNYLDSLDIRLVGGSEEEEFAFAGRFRARLSKENFYKPRFMEIKETYVFLKGPMSLISEYYQIFPESFLCREDFTLMSYSRVPGIDKDKAGFCWLDIKNNKWVWMNGNSFKADTFFTTAGGGGSIAVVRDDYPPDISSINVRPQGMYSRKNFKVEFVAEDTLSGIPEDGLTVKLDGKWLPADYDPETFRCVVEPLEELKGGEHHLAVIVTDRVGNKTEYYAIFRVH